MFTHQPAGLWDADGVQMHTIDLQGLGMQMGIADGVQLIAGGIDHVLQRLRVTASNAAIRLEIPGRSPHVATALVVLRVDELNYSGARPPCSTVFCRGWDWGVALVAIALLAGMTCEVSESLTGLAAVPCCCRCCS